MGNKPAGGKGSKAMAPRASAYFTGRPSNIVRPAGAAGLGSMYGDHTERGATNFRGEKLMAGKASGQVPMGNELTTNVGGGGPGKGRTLYGQSGTNQTYGPPAPGNPAPQRKSFD